VFYGLATLGWLASELSDAGEAFNFCLEGSGLNRGAAGVVPLGEDAARGLKRGHGDFRASARMQAFQGLASNPGQELSAITKS